MPTLHSLPSPASPSSASVASALSCTKKGRLTYDRDWLSRSDSIERVLQEVTTDINNLDIHNNDVAQDNANKNKKKKGAGAPRTSQGGEKNNENIRVASPTEVKTKNDVVKEGLSPYKVTINREDELNIEDPKNITKAKTYLKDSKSDDHLDRSIIHRGNKDLRVVIERLRISNLDCNRTFLIDQIEPSRKTDTNEMEKSSKYIIDTPKEFLTDDDDDTEASISPEKCATTPVTKCILTSPTSPEEEELLSFEVKIKQETQQRLQERKKKWDEDLERIRERSRLELEAKLQETSHRETLELERIIQEKEEAERRAKQKAVEDQLEREARQKELEEMVKQAENKKMEDLRRQQQLEADRDRLCNIDQDLRNKCNEITVIWNQSRQAEISLDLESPKGDLEDVEKVLAKLNKLVAQGAASENDWSSAQAVSDRLDAATQDLRNKINMAAKAKEAREAQKVAEEEKQKQVEAAKEEARARATAEEAAKTAENSNQAAAAASQAASPPPAPAAAAPTQTESSLHVYLQLRNFKNNFVSNIVFSDAEKSFKFDLQKAVNTPMNAISAYTSAHLKDKLDKLTALLTGNTVTVGEKQVNASSHPCGLAFCLNLAAMKMANQGADVISSKAEAAFPFATVAIALWDRFPDFGKLLLAHIYEICPYLIPFHPTRQEGQTDREFYASRGYKYDGEGVVEEQDKYLKRMSGVVRLYAALSVAKLPKDSATTCHPHGPVQVWSLLAGVMSLHPVADITATVLLCVLEVTGSRMIANYGGQFGKMLAVMAKQYVPLLEQVKVEGGPVERLVDFLAMAMKQKAVKEPEGVLKAGFV